MTRKPILPLMAIAMLAACGGGGSAGLTSTPAPAPAPAPAPTPTPTATAAPGFTPTVTPTETLPGTDAAAGKITGGSFEEVLVATPKVSIGRDASGNYLVSVAGVSGQTSGTSSGLDRRFEFLASDRTTEADGTQRYTNGRSGSIFPGERSSLTVLPANTAANPLKHINFSYLIVCGPATCNTSQPGGAMIAFGERTASSEVPVSGSATYAGTFQTSRGPEFVGSSGGDSNDISGTLGQLSGAMGVTVDFGRGSVTGSMSQIVDGTGYYTYNAETQAHRLADMTMSGSLASGLLSGTIDPAANSAFNGGTWNGLFFGPQAAELGGSFILRSMENVYAGYFGAAKQ